MAHFNYCFFGRSETFIYRLVAGLQNIKPVLFANRFENLDQFPFPATDRYLLKAPKYSPTWFVNGVSRKMFQRDFRVSRIFKERKVSAIHAHFGTTGYECLLYKKMSGLPLLTTFYGADASSVAALPVWKARYKELFREGNSFLVEGECMKGKLVALGCPEKKISIQRIGLPIEKINYLRRDPKKDSNGNVTFIFCGRFIEKKGLLQVLDAIGRLPTEYKKRVLFKIIGDGPQKAIIQSRIKELGLQSQVELLGFLAYDRYIKAMESADIFVHPSVTGADGDSEGGAPTTILEAQAMGLPILASDHADIPNIVAPGKSALLCREGNTDELASLMQNLIEHQDLWPSMSESGRAFVEQFHDIKKEILNLENIYERTINEGHLVGASAL